jgi:hypothetical protein
VNRALLNRIRATQCEPSKVVDPRQSGSSTDVDRARELLRKAASDCGYTFDALGAAMGKDRSYVHRVLNGPDRVTLDFITALPDDVEAKYEQLRAEGFGLIVVAPVDEGTALKHLVSGLVGLLHRRSA